jgi:uncharacterized protein
MPSLERRVAGLDWTRLEAAFETDGWAVTPPLLTARECAALRALFGEDRRFRATVDMARLRFGVGQYRYFAAPLPRPVAALRRALYRRLVPVANRWMAAVGAAERYPASLDAWLARCADHGQTRPTPLLLRYGAGGYNCLHQDRYGALAFPLQVTVALGRPGVDYRGGEFLLVEQRPRAQSRGEAVALAQGEAIIFPNDVRPVAGTRGAHRVHVRHGVATVRAGERMTLGLIFHDAA